MITDAQLHAAVDRLARTDDGRTLYLFLQKRLMAISTSISDGALQADHGERTFAAKLIGLMATGIRESDGSSNSTRGPDGERTITFAVPGPRSTGGARGAGRRVTADTFVAGYDSPDRDPG